MSSSALPFEALYASPEITPRSYSALSVSRLQLRLSVVRFHRGGASFLVHQIAFQPSCAALILRFRRFQLKPGIDCCLLDLRITHLQQNGVRLHLRARQHANSNNRCFGLGRDLAHRFLRWYERADPADLPNHRPTLDRVGPHRATFDRRGGWSESIHDEGEGGDHDCDDRPDEDLAAAFALNSST